ncbi:type III secretion system protein [Aeromonas salmonicida subsp. salmonicida]|uniref:AscQ protein n=3 Tax=Aeromonas salmonicida subsp. salmonicida TaxID=29491 RepID=Q70WP3_AERSS|nr:SctQ family type III secretion system cytoplasmic ring protein AscQ [Aeromonas salmonicida]ABO92553.1 AscQ protein [Aeromonas salmonicida subsp. salmonicida A449]ASD49274.1 YscQ family Type III secretion inner membrane protein [Aeromonas salmonicida subsp. salmonicida]ASI21568.1 type III secretion system protein [Aeromonas salmonicida]ASI25894.1 type III secretion system protein [Aeromonas salmonicida]ASI29991.1 type III secretion system protein [Aeromonas salmonicida]
MTPIALTSASLAELTLQQTLSQYRQHFGWSGGELLLAIGLPPATLDTLLQLQWQGLSLPLLCHGAELAHWLAPDLQQAALFSLPEQLQLALIERLGQPLGGLTCSVLTQQESNVQTDETALQLLLQREGASLALWLPQPEPLLSKLPPRPRQQRLPLLLTLSLQWGEMGLTMDELATLAIGDVLLPPPDPQLGQQLLICVEGRPFAYCQPNQQHLELTAMHNAASAEPFGPTELDQLPIQVSFEVGRQTLDWHTLTSLQPGALIDLGTPLDGEVRIISNGHLLGVGRLVEIQGRLGVRVERLDNESLS